jgi:hypothetical protein
MAIGLSGSFKQLPARRDTSELLLDCLLFIKQPSDPDSNRVALAAVGSGVRHLNTRPWRWALSYDDLTTVLSTYDYDAPRDVNQPFNIERLNSDNKPDGRIWYKNPKQFFMEHSRSTQDGTPSVYTIHGYHANGLITLDTAPNQSFVTNHPTLRFWYLRSVLPPATDSERIDVPASVEHFIEWYAKWQLAAIYDPSKASIAERHWRSIWQEIVSMDNAEVDWAQYV